jgi:hypothetical protein
MMATISSSVSFKRETTSKCGVRMLSPSDEILSVARTLARGDEVPFETVMEEEENDLWEEEEGCWARMRKGVWVEWFMSYEFFDL